jgi:hypothetical protein
MTNGKRDELIDKTKAWRRQLALLEDENIHFKTRLADVLQSHFHKDQLDQLEHFQNSFLKMDEQLGLLKHEVREQLYQLQQDRVLAGGALNDINDLQQRLELKIAIVQENFDRLSREFNGYLQQYPAL